MEYSVESRQIIYTHAQKVGAEIFEIDSKDVQDTSVLIEQVSVSGKDVVYTEGILVKAMLEGRWLLIYAPDEFNPFVEFISSCREIPGEMN